MAVKRFTNKKGKQVKKTKKIMRGAGKTGKPGKQKAKDLMKTYNYNTTAIRRTSVNTTNSLYNNKFLHSTFSKKIKTTRNASNYRQLTLPNFRYLNNNAYQTYIKKYTPEVMKNLQNMSMTTKLQRMRNMFRSSQNRAKKEKERQTAGEIFRAISSSRKINESHPARMML